MAGDWAWPQDAARSWVWGAALISLSTVATILFLDNFSCQVREVPLGPGQERQKGGQNQDDFGVVTQSRGKTMKLIYMYQAEKNQLNKFNCPLRPWLLSLGLWAGVCCAEGLCLANWRRANKFLRGRNLNTTLLSARSHWWSSQSSRLVLFLLRFRNWC